MATLDVDSGTPLPLVVVLPDAATNKYPRAYVTNLASAPIAGSPFDLAHVGSPNGKYTNLTVIPGLNGIYLVTYIIFSDSGHTTEDLSYEQGSDVFQVRPAPTSVPAPVLDPSAECSVYGFIDDVLVDATPGAILRVETTDVWEYGGLTIRPSRKDSVADGSGMVQLVLLESTSINKKYKFTLLYNDDLTNVQKKKVLGYAKVPAQASENITNLVFTATAT